MEDLISRAEAIALFERLLAIKSYGEGERNIIKWAILELSELPPVTPVNYGSTKSVDANNTPTENTNAPTKDAIIKQIHKQTSKDFADCDLISKQAAIDAIEQSGLSDDSQDTAIRLLEALPSVPPQSRREWYDRGYKAGRELVEQQRIPGKWEPIKRGERGYSAGDFRCSKCGKANPCYHLTAYCPNCGADMRGGEMKIFVYYDDDDHPITDGETIRELSDKTGIKRDTIWHGLKRGSRKYAVIEIEDSEE